MQLPIYLAGMTVVPGIITGTYGYLQMKWLNMLLFL